MRDAQAEVNRDRRIAREIRAEGRIHGPIRHRQPVIGLRLVHGLDRGFQIRPVVHRRPPQLFERANLIGKIERSGDVELLHRRPVVQQHQQLDLRRSQIHQRRLNIGLILHALQFQPLKIHLRDVAGLQPVVAHLRASGCNTPDSPA